jgi:hypothetical protein
MNRIVNETIPNALIITGRITFPYNRIFFNNVIVCGRKYPISIG